MKKTCIIITVLLVVFSFKQKDITWVAIGDSITYLNDHPAEAGNRITKGYMTMVSESLPGIHYINKGYNGWTSGNIADAINTLGLTKADVYSVFLGTNDWWQGRPLGTINDYRQNTGNKTVYGSFRIIIDKLHSLNDNAKIILITPMQRGDFIYINGYTNNAYGSYKEKNGQSLAQFAAAVITIAKEEKTVVVDLYNKSGITLDNVVKFKRLKDPQTGIYKNFTFPGYIGISFDPQHDDYPYPAEAADMTYDGLHPSDKGYAVIASMLVKEMNNLK